MSFRKNDVKGRDQRLKWKRFLEANKDLIARIGLTSPTFETEERFEDLLMHGHMDHHDDLSEYSASEMNEEQYELFKVLIDKYFQAGYHDPSLMAVSHDERIEFARKYPNQFDADFAEIIAKLDAENI